jgi:UDP-N-acetylmuramate dehydrogenase
MTKIFQDYDLTKLNTFGISAQAKFFVELLEEAHLKDLFISPEFKNSQKLFLGGGSNVLFTKDFDGIVVLNKLKGIEISREDSENVFIKSMGGEMWQNLVEFAVGKGYWGIENLSLIPGTVGASPIQNIGAYGVELKDILENVEAYNIETGEKKVFSNEECLFGYRDSVFKNKFKGKYFVSAISLKLNKKQNKNFKYRALQEYLDKNNIKVESSKDVSDAIIEIRKSKLPDPRVVGNAGSFFKNVFVSKQKLKSLLAEYKNVPYYEEEENFKIPAGWLIEQCGWKGRRIGNVGVHDKQALVLVNYGGATGEEVKDLSEQVISSVNSKFGLILEREVNLIP